jgi:hypothetical protein
MVPRTGSYAYDVGIWELSIVQGPFSVAVLNLRVTIRNVCIAARLGVHTTSRRCGGGEKRERGSGAVSRQLVASQSTAEPYKSIAVGTLAD